MSLTVIATLIARPDAEAPLLAALQALQRATLPEDGCLHYALHRDLDDRCRFTFYETWSSRAAHEAHMQSAHLLAFVDQAAAWLVHSEVRLLTVLDAV